MKLSTNQVLAKLKTTDFSYLDKPGKNKGARGQLLEVALGLENNNDLQDLTDGEIKTFTMGQSIAVTSLAHCLPDIIDGSLEFEESKVGIKMSQTVYVGFSKDNEYLGSKVVNEDLDPVHYYHLAEDYGYISAEIKRTYVAGDVLHTITGPNKLLQIRTKATKDKHGNYTPLCYNGVVLKDKYMAFYLTGEFGKGVLK